MAGVSKIDESVIQVLGRKAKPRTTYARYYRNKRSSHVYDICDVPLSPQRKSQHSRLGTSISKHQDPRPTEDNHTTPSGSQKHTVKSSLTATPPVRRPLPDSADGRASPRSITHRIPVEPTNDPALQMPAASSNKILTQLGNKLSRKPTAPWKKTREAAKVETPKQAKSLPPNTNHLATEVSNEVVPNEHTRAGAAVSDLNLGYSGSTEMARVDSESDPVRAKLSQTQTEDNDEYFNVEAITSCKIGTRGMVLLQVKWTGYEDPADLTWEPERTLRSDIPHLLDAYFEERGGREDVLNDLREKRTSGKAYPSKRGIARAKGRISKRGV